MNRLVVIGGKLQGTEAVTLARAAGIPTLLIDRDSKALASLLADKFVPLDVVEDLEGFLGLLHREDLVLPAMENQEVLDLLEKERERIGERCLGMAFDFDAYRITSSKEESDRLFRSLGLPVVDAEVWLGDSMGEMAAYFSLADLAFIGGSLLPLGGQNLIEAAACGCPVLVGPHTFNFLQATEDAIAAGAALRVANADELGAQVNALLHDGERLGEMRRAAGRFASAHQGAAERMLGLIERWTGRAGR